MPRATLMKPTRIGTVSFISVACLTTAACGSDTSDSADGTGGTGAVATFGTGGTGAAAAVGTGGTGAAAAVGTGGTGAVSTATGGQACIPANPAVPADHAATEEFDAQPCTACHGALYTGGIVYADASGAVPVAQATVTITPVGGTPRTAVTGSQGVFYFQSPVQAPYDVCVSKCPDTLCSTATDHPDSNDCGICHGVTTTKIHLP